MAQTAIVSGAKHTGISLGDDPLYPPMPAAPAWAADAGGAGMGR
jgi:hypothetical protein